MKTLPPFASSVLALTFMLGVACDSGSDDTDTANADESAAESSSESGDTPPFGNEEDLAMAEDLWQELMGHESWASFEGLDGFQASGAPHGAFVQFYINDIAAGDVTGLPNGSIVLKKNYEAEDEATLGALTVMQKIDGYSPDAGDWFWVKFLPDGSVDVNPDGVPLAGRVGLGTDTACIGCHKSEADYVFVN